MSDTFGGFEYPQENWSKLPHAIIGALPLIDSLGELKCLLYILRHTWGYQEFDEPKRISLDEFEHGRKHSRAYRDKHPEASERMDSGTGLSRKTIIDGLRRAEKHGFIAVEIDGHDAARVTKYYQLNMGGIVERGGETPPLGCKNSTPEVENLHPSSGETTHRSWKETHEKETKERYHDQDDSLLSDLIDLIGLSKEDALAFVEKHGRELAKAYLVTVLDRGPDDPIKYLFKCAQSEPYYPYSAEQSAKIRDEARDMWFLGHRTLDVENQAGGKIDGELPVANDMIVDMPDPDPGESEPVQDDHSDAQLNPIPLIIPGTNLNAQTVWTQVVERTLCELQEQDHGNLIEGTKVVDVQEDRLFLRADLGVVDWLAERDLCKTLLKQNLGAIVGRPLRVKLTVEVPGE